jgi:hypothetical protein
MNDDKLRIVFEQYEIEDLLGLLTDIRTDKISKKSTKKRTMNIREQKNAERISYTMAPGGENHRDNQFIGVEPVPGMGLTAEDVKSIADVYAKKGYEVEYIDLNDVSGIEDTDEYMDYTKNGGEVTQASVCIIRNFVDAETTDQIYEDSIADEWDAKYFDPKQYESVRNSNGKARRWKNPKTGKSKTIKVNWILDEKGDPVLDNDGEPTKDPDVAAGVVKNKLARTNICLRPGPTALDLRKWCKARYGKDWRKENKKGRLNEAKEVLKVSQEPDYRAGKGRIVDLCTKKALDAVVTEVLTIFNQILEESGSDSRVQINVVEGNRYYSPKTGIGFHGDTERVIVIALTIGGGGNYPIVWRWFHKGKIVGEPINVGLNDGDLYIMSEKAVGVDWMTFKRGFTLRHAAGAEKYRKVKPNWLKKKD